LADVIFYEKPGCAGNARQKALLKASGHTLDVRSLLSEPWTGERLRAFFGARPVSEWFNMSSPRVKSAEILPAEMSAEHAIAAMLADPLLIRRPLLEADGRRETGFDTDLIDAWIGLTPVERPVGEGCPRGSEMPPCPAPDKPQ
jgi:nitrogenase-associated protein